MDGFVLTVSIFLETFSKELLVLFLEPVRVGKGFDSPGPVFPIRARRIRHNFLQFWDVSRIQTLGIFVLRFRMRLSLSLNH